MEYFETDASSLAILFKRWSYQKAFSNRILTFVQASVISELTDCDVIRFTVWSVSQARTTEVKEEGVSLASALDDVGCSVSFANGVNWRAPHLREARLAVHDSRRGTHARLRFPFGSVRHRDLLHRGPQTSLALRLVHNSRIRSLIRTCCTGTRKSTQSLHVHSALTDMWLTLAEKSLIFLFYLENLFDLNKLT